MAALGHHHRSNKKRAIDLGRAALSFAPDDLRLRDNLNWYEMGIA
jgi:hypothetical protein